MELGKLTQGDDCGRRKSHRRSQVHHEELNITRNWLDDVFVDPYGIGSSGATYTDAETGEPVQTYVDSSGRSYYTYIDSSTRKLVLRLLRPADWSALLRQLHSFRLSTQQPAAAGSPSRPYSPRHIPGLRPIEQKGFYGTDDMLAPVGSV